MFNWERTFEARAWQTKTIKPGTTSRIYPMTCVKFSYTGKPWFEYWWKVHRALEDKPAFARRVYLLPQPRPDRTGFVPRPCPRHTALSWYRDLVRRYAKWFDMDESDVMKLKLSGLRVFGSNEAFVCGVPKIIKEKCRELDV